MLRLLYYPDQTPEGGPYPPEADFADNWNGKKDYEFLSVS